MDKITKYCNIKSQNDKNNQHIESKRQKVIYRGQIDLSSLLQTKDN